MTELSLVADIGGTNTRVALADGRTVKSDTIKRYRNADHDGLESVLQTYMTEMDVDPVAAGIAVAGPVRDGKATMTNLDWTMDKETLERAANSDTVAILNDLQAQGQALGYLDPSLVTLLVEGRERDNPNAAKLVIGIGTGFNVAPVYNVEEGRVVPPAEAGHANLPIRTEAELRLCQYVSSAHGFAAIEDVVSGRGLERVYRWLGHEVGDEREMSAKDIMEECARDKEGRAAEAAHVFSRMLGRVAGNLALVHLPFGGIFLVGGVARALSPYLVEYGFEDAFRDKGRFADFMKNFSIYVIEDDYAALIGSASHLHALRFGKQPIS
ncbi:ROK family protein [Aestuariibius sp. 2305UL40-4]|uniref:glucokinase n=1 Tax=Aestuariibius violaceus TaxID=3234132 RepID=UPI00345E3F00